MYRKKRNDLGPPALADLKAKHEQAKRDEKVWPESYEGKYTPSQSLSSTGVIKVSVLTLILPKCSTSKDSSSVWLGIFLGCCCGLQLSLNNPPPLSPFKNARPASWSQMFTFFPSVFVISVGPH